MLAWTKAAAASLPLEALQIRRVVGEFGLEDLDGHAAIQQALLAEIDLGRCPPPHAPQHLHVAQRPAGEIGHRRRLGNLQPESLIASRSSNDGQGVRSGASDALRPDCGDIHYVPETPLGNIRGDPLQQGFEAVRQRLKGGWTGAEGHPKQSAMRVLGWGSLR